MERMRTRTGTLRPGILQGEGTRWLMEMILDNVKVNLLQVNMKGEWPGGWRQWTLERRQDGSERRTDPCVCSEAPTTCWNSWQLISDSSTPVNSSELSDPPQERGSRFHSESLVSPSGSERANQTVGDWTQSMKHYTNQSKTNLREWPSAKTKNPL